MTLIGEGTRITLKNILYLTDFSEPSEMAIPYAISLARNYGARVHALYVLTPAIPEACREAIQADVELAHAEMSKVDSQFAGVVHDTAVVRGAALWLALEPIITDHKIDLIVLGTHGRAGVSKLLLGSFAEEIFRRSSVPVLTIGPDIRQNLEASANFRSVLFATDFGKPSAAAASFAVSLAEENDAQLVLLNVMPNTDGKHHTESLIGDVMHRLLELVPIDARMWCRPTAIVERGEVAERILDTAANCGTDLIVLGVRDAAKHLGAATHLGRAIAHKIVVKARCPVLTVRG